MNDPTSRIRQLALALEELRERVVFLGGAVMALMVTDKAAPPARATDDVDGVLDVHSIADHAQVEQRMIELGFRRGPDGPTSRWLLGSLKLDLVAPVPILGFSSRWYASVLSHSVETQIEGTSVRVASSVYFLATKFEAFFDRGLADPLASSDLEDIIAIIDGRAELMEEIRAAEPDVRAYLAESVRRLRETSDEVRLIQAHLPGDEGSQARLMTVLSRFAAIEVILPQQSS